MNLRRPTAGGLYAWELEKDKRPLNVWVDGPFVSGDAEMMVDAAVAGVGLCGLPNRRRIRLR